MSPSSHYVSGIIDHILGRDALKPIPKTKVGIPPNSSIGYCSWGILKKYIYLVDNFIYF